MKTTSWINLIGILCIIFGAWGLLESVSMFLLQMAHLPETQAAEISTDMQEQVGRWQRQSMLINYGGAVVHVLYLVAGIFFLLRKSFSLRLMYVALGVSFVYAFAPALVIPGGIKLVTNIFGLLGPTIDAALLIGVYSIGKYYYDAPETAVYFLGAGRLTQRQLKIVSLIGLFCVLIPLSFFGWWLALPREGLTPVEASDLYNSYFPEFLRGRFVKNYLSLALCIAAVLLSSISFRISGTAWRVLNVAVMVLAGLLILINLFSLM